MGDFHFLYCKKPYTTCICAHVRIFLYTRSYTVKNLILHVFVHMWAYFCRLVPRKGSCWDKDRQVLNFDRICQTVLHKLYTNLQFLRNSWKCHFAPHTRNKRRNVSFTYLLYFCQMLKSFKFALLSSLVKAKMFSYAQSHLYFLCWLDYWDSRGK